MSTTPDVISIKVRTSRNEEVHFKLKPQTKMDKVIRAFAEKLGLDFSSIRQSFDGERINPLSTAADLGLEDGDIIDCLEQQVGGCFPI